MFEHGPGEVLRRYREPRDTDSEVAAMEHARAHGYPVPAARAFGNTDIVMERLDGPTMLDDLARNPWRMGRHADALAKLHKQLHSIAAPPGLASPVGEGDSLLHLDLHPDNVMVSSRGPVVIDWPNAARGPGAADVAHTWIVLACSTPTTGAVRKLASEGGRRAFVALFLRHFNRDQIAAHLRVAGEYRLAHRTLPERELRAIEKMTRP